MRPLESLQENSGTDQLCVASLSSKSVSVGKHMRAHSIAAHQVPEMRYAVPDLEVRMVRRM